MDIYNPSAIGTMTGFGMPTGGAAGFILSKISLTNYNTQWINPYSLFNWTDAGTMTITSNGTQPVKGTTIYDKVRHRLINSDTYELDYNLACTTTGTAGTGQYILDLPTTITFPAAVLKTTATTVETVVNYALATVGTALDSSASRFRPAMIVPYNDTQFRVIHTDASGTGWTWFGTGGVNFGLDGVSLKIRFYNTI